MRAKNKKGKYGTAYNGVFFRLGSHTSAAAMKYHVDITINKKRFRSEQFETEKEAAIAADKIYIEHNLFHLCNFLKKL